MKGMHLQRGLSMINTKKRKTKITKRKMAELEVRWRIHNKAMKQKGMHHHMNRPMTQIPVSKTVSIVFCVSSIFEDEKDGWFIR